MKEDVSLKRKYQNGADEMMLSLKTDKLTRDEKIEWFGYIRALRDCAFEAGILNETTIQAILEEALTIIKKIDEKEYPEPLEETA